jgi:hypothetical protein
VIFICYLFWGPLFPWNPLKIGYQKISSSKATIYITEMTSKDSVIYRIDKIIQEEEKFHNLEYHEDFKIMIVSKDSHMKRFLPWLSGSGYSVSFGIANVIYIGPTARNSPHGIERYLKHEMSHLLISQNTTFKNDLKIHEQGWFSEGIAEYISGHRFYSKDEFLDLCRRKNYKFSSLNEKSPLEMSPNELKFKYTFYGFFLDFLIENYGIDKFQKYLINYLDNPGQYKELFIDVYSIDHHEILKNFQSHLFHT